MEALPKVSVICLCHNQKHFVAEAIHSVWTQSYKNIELIVVDDGSTDGSKTEIIETIKGKDVQFIDIPKNIGNCAAFNQGFSASTGDYVIDLAADDILLPARVEEGINDFANASAKAGVHFSDAFQVNEQGEMLGTHFTRNQDGEFIEDVPTGKIYLELISKYFISAPTMMIRRAVLEQLNGYDEKLMYEDFDFWIRSSRNWEYLFNKAPLVKKREVRHSHGKSQTKLRNRHLLSTFRVCEKIFELNVSKEEDQALIKRCNLEIRQCIKTLNFGLIQQYRKLKRKAQRRLSSPSNIDK